MLCRRVTSSGGLNIVRSNCMNCMYTLVNYKNYIIIFFLIFKNLKDAELLLKNEELRDLRTKTLKNEELRDLRTKN